MHVVTKYHGIMFFNSIYFYTYIYLHYSIVILLYLIILFPYSIKKFITRVYTYIQN